MVTVSVVVPEVVIVDGLKVQVLSAGRPAQLNCTVPVKPSLAATFKTRPPDPPGLETAIAVLFEEITKSGFIVIGVAAELEPV